MTNHLVFIICLAAEIIDWWGNLEAVARSCYPQCICLEIYPGKILVNCTNAGLDALPVYLPETNQSDTTYELVLPRNKLTKLEPRKYLFSVSVLDLSFNKIEHIDFQIYLSKWWYKLQELHIHNNLLPVMPKEAEDLLNHLQVVTLHENPWFCDCDIIWLGKWVQNAQNISKIQENIEFIRCNKPQNFFLMPVVNLTKADVCDKQDWLITMPRHAVIIITIGVLYLIVGSLLGILFTLRRRMKIGVNELSEKNTCAGDDVDKRSSYI